MAATLPGTLPSANYKPTYRSNGACDDLAELVAPYSLSRAQLAEATGIADEATANSWVEQCCPGLAADVPVPLEPVLRYLDETYLPDPANWPGTNASRTSPHVCSPALLLTPSVPTVPATIASSSRSLQPSCSSPASGMPPKKHS